MSLTQTTQAAERSGGRSLIWAGLGVCLLGLALIFAQFYGLGQLRTPWYSPVLATIGALLLLVAVLRRPGVLRILILLLVAGLAAFQWFAMGVAMKLPAYEGPVREGEAFPEFSATRADGSTFTDADLRDGRTHVLAFYRGRW